MANILTDGNGNGIPQYQNGSGEFIPLLGDKAPYTQVIDGAGAVLFTSTNPGNVKITKGSAQGAVVVVPNDTTNLTSGTTTGIYVGSTGALKVDMADGTTVTFNGIAPGIIHPISVKRVYATGTTADLILAVY